jgi:endonuclease V
MQATVASKVLNMDLVPWTVTGAGLPPAGASPLLCCGADVSFSIAQPERAVATITVVKLEHNGKMNLVYSASQQRTVEIDYAPTYLSFRESPCIVDLIAAMPCTLRDRISVVLTDGNGVLHPRGAGLACHVAIECGGIPTIGVAKSLMCVDGLEERRIRKQTSTLEHGVALPLVGISGKTWGNAIITGNATAKPLYISVGHRVSLDTATRLVRALCLYRVPEPIRFADIHSREALRGNIISIPYDESCTSPQP